MRDTHSFFPSMYSNYKQQEQTLRTSLGLLTSQSPRDAKYAVLIVWTPDTAWTKVFDLTLGAQVKQAESLRKMEVEFRSNRK